MENIFDNFIYFEGFIYSFEKVDDSDLPKDQTGEDDGVEYNISLEYHQELDFAHQSVSIFFRAFVNKLIYEAGMK